jgi:hypothetical protein
MNTLLTADKSLLARVKKAVRYIIKESADYYPLNGDWSSIGVGIWVDTPRSNNEFVLMLADKEIGVIDMALLRNRKKF